MITAIINHRFNVVYLVLCNVKLINMNINRENTEIVTTRPPFFAEGTSIRFGKEYEPNETEIQKLLLSEGWRCDEIDIFYDDLQSVWRWSCSIKRVS